MLSPAWEKLHAAVKMYVCGELMREVYNVEEDVFVKQKKLQDLFRRSGLEERCNCAGLFEEL